MRAQHMISIIRTISGALLKLLIIASLIESILREIYEWML